MDAGVRRWKADLVLWKVSTLGRRIAFSLFLVLAIADVAQVGAFGYSIRRRFMGLERRETVEDIRRLAAAVEAEKTSLSELVRDYAGWDDARRYVEGSYPRFPADNFNADWGRLYDIDAVILVSPGKKVLWSGTRIGGVFGPLEPGKPSGGYPAPGATADYLSGVVDGEKLLGFRETAGGLLLACAYPVTDSTFSASPLGWVLFTRRVEDPLIARLSERSGLGVRLPGTEKPDRAAKQVKADAYPARYFDLGKDRVVLFSLQGADGEAVADLWAEKPRRLDEPALGLFLELIASLAITAVATLYFLMYSMRGLAVRPLARMAGHLEACASKGSADSPLAMGAAAGRVDEIGVVGDRIDALLASLDSKREELERLNGELSRMAQYDHLTGLANRRFLDEFASREIKRLRRESRSHRNKGRVAVVICDIDCFKAYNDEYGHLAGDECLKRVAGALAGAVRRPTDLACRFGGEEFLILLMDTDAEGARVVADNFRADLRALALPFAISAVAPVVTVSVGVASGAVGDAFDFGKLIGLADAAMYRAKKAGRDRIVVDGGGT
jgi:diguanylate cyclase (GGDEF)-like protein